MKLKNAIATRRARFWSAARLLSRGPNPAGGAGTMTAWAALAGTTLLASHVQGAVFTYTPTNNGSGPDNWDTSTNFSSTPRSGKTTEVTFGSNMVPLTSGLVSTSTNNLGDFVLGTLDLLGIDPAAGGNAAIININSATNSFLDFQSNGSTTPVINLNAMASGAGLTYNVNSNIALTNNTTFQGTGTATFNFDGSISGAGTLTMGATSTLTLGGANTYSGGTVVNAGTLNLASTTALGTGPLTLGGGSVTASATTASTNLSTTAAGAIVFTGAGYTFTGAPAISANLNLTGASGGIIKSVNAGNPVISGNLDLGGVARTFALADTSGDAAPELTVSGVITNGSVVMDNTYNGTSTQEFGSLLFSGANTYTGGTTINVGRLEITNESALGTGNVTVGTRGTLAFGGSGQATTPQLALANNLTFGHTVNGNYGQDALQANSGLALLTGTVTLAAATQFNVGSTLEINPYNVNADVITGAYALTKTGGGALILNGAQTYTGGTTVTGGLLQLGDLNNPLAGSVNGSVMGTINQTGGGINIQNFTAQTFANTVTGTGSLEITGAAPVTITGSVALGGGNVYGLAISGSNQQVTIASGATVTSSAFSSLGIANGDAVTLNLAGTASLTIGSDFNVSDNGGSNGVLNIGTATGDSPKLSINTLYDGKGNNVAGEAATSGIVNQIAGTVTQNGGAVDWRIGGGVGVNDVGVVGVYNLSGGSIAMTTANFQVGAYGQGQFLQTGGTFSNSGGYPDVGRYTTGYGVVDVSAGTFSQTGTGFRMIVGEQGTGIMSVRGTGTASFTGGLSIGFDGGTGIFNLDAGGTLTTAYVSPTGTAPTAPNTVAGSSSTFNFNGGTLKNTAATTSFFNYINTANVFGGGAIFDTTAGNVTVGQSLVAPAGLGVQSVTVTNGGSGYVTPPIVKISGGSGTGATGIATINAGGQITGIIITSPGTGYLSSDQLTFTLETAGFDSTGTPSGSGAALTANLAANVSGGLTKLGANSLTLSGTNTYTGGTTISAGTLVSGSATALPANTALTNNSVVNFNGQYIKSSGSTVPGLTLSSLTAGATSQSIFSASSSGVDAIAITNAASVASGAKLTLGIVAGATSLTPGTYNLFTDAAGGLANFTLSNSTATVNGQAYALTLNATNTADTLTIGLAQTAKLYYTGNTSNNLSVTSNYATTSAGTTASTIAPSGITDVVFTANTATATNFTTTLGGLAAVNSLEFTGTGTPAATTAVTIGGPGTLTLNATANTFAAGTAIVIDAGAAADTISAGLNLATSESFNNNSANQFTISGAIGSTNAGTALTLGGTGTGGFLLSGANTYAGSTVIAVPTAGTVTLGNASALGNAGNTVLLNSGNLDINGQTVAQSAITFGGGRLVDSNATPGSIALSSTGAAFNVNATYSATTAMSTANVMLTGASNFVTKAVAAGNVVATGGLVLGGATTFALADTSADAAPEFAVTGTIRGTGGLTLNNMATVSGVTLANTTDFATLLLSGNNTYTGGTNITEGRVVVTSGNALGTGAVVIGQTAGGGGGTLQIGNGNYNTTSSPFASGILTTGITIPNAISFGGAVSGSYNYGIGNDNGANTLSGAVTLTAANQTIQMTGGSLTFSGPISQSNGVTAGITENGSGTGTLVLSGSNSYTGATTVTAGTLSVGDLENGGVNSSIGASSNASSNLVLGGNSTLLYTGTGSVTNRGFTVTAGGVTVDNANALTFGGQVVQATGSNSSFTKNNTGTLSFTNTTGTNTFTSGTTGNGLGFVANAGITVLGGTVGAPLAQTNQINSQLIVGSINSATSPTAEMDINGGTTTITDYIGVGRGNGTNNAQTTLTLNNNAIVTSPNFSIGYNNGVAGFTSSPTVNFNGTSSYTDAGVFTVGESVNGTGGVSTINVNGSATVNLTSTGTMPIIGLNGAAVFNQNGGTVTTADSIRLAANGSSTATYNLNGGILNTATVQQGSGTANFVFNGGTLQAAASDNPGTTTFVAGVTTTVANGGAIINSNGFNVTVASVLQQGSGSTGGLTKAGAGMLTLAAANTYLGTTTVSAGTLAISVNGGLAMGNVSVAAGATLSLASGVTAAHNTTTTTTLTLASATTSLVTLSGTGVQDTLGSLVVNGMSEAPGTYGAPGSGATFTNVADFTGTGEILVETANEIPEPSSLAAMIGGVGLLAYARRRKVCQWLRLTHRA